MPGPTWAFRPFQSHRRYHPSLLHWDCALEPISDLRQTTMAVPEATEELPLHCDARLAAVDHPLTDDELIRRPECPGDAEEAEPIERAEGWPARRQTTCR